MPIYSSMPLTNMPITTTNSTNSTNTTNTKDEDKTLGQRLKEMEDSRTERGTRIVKQGQDMDKNMFLKILAAEMSNQNPENAKDGTEYVAQFAQFAGVEQMTNLNSTMKLNSANQLMDKHITLRKTDETGTPYAGRVLNVTKNGDEIKIKIFMDGYPKNADQTFDDCTKEFSMEDITKIEDIDYYSDYNNSMMLLNASSMIGKEVEGVLNDEKNTTFKGIVKSITKDKGEIKVTVAAEDGKTQEVPLGNITKIQQG